MIEEITYIIRGTDRLNSALKEKCSDRQLLDTLLSELWRERTWANLQKGFMAQREHSISTLELLVIVHARAVLIRRGMNGMLGPLQPTEEECDKWWHVDACAGWEDAISDILEESQAGFEGVSPELLSRFSRLVAFVPKTPPRISAAEYDDVGPES